ncbi:SdrD B-like domain-containing protein [Gymnodinialimonas sp. 2305UL16-5]|uniref:DUF7507 domain-containing protein n=1 Tax=Gymnodinialimonas mytili TaxID=3126503 RepID=UPI0030AB2746
MEWQSVALRVLLATIITVMTWLGYAGPSHAQSVDWLLNYSDATDPIPAGGTVDYPATVTNNGSAAPATWIEFTVPNLTTLTGTLEPSSGPVINNCRVVASTATAPFTGGTPLPANAGERVICDVPPLATLQEAGFTPQLLTEAPASPPQSYNLTMTVLDVNGVDSSSTNNSLTETTTVRAGADLSIEIDLPPTAVSGGRINFDVDVENLGPNDSNGYNFTFAVPSGLADLNLPAGCAESSGTVTCTITSTFAVGASSTFTFDAAVVAGSGSDVSATANVNGDSPGDPVASNDTSTDQMLITTGTDVSVTISRDTPFEVLENSPVEFTLTPVYSGDAPDTVTVTHTVPPNFTFVPGDIVAPGWTITQNGNDLTFSRVLPANASSGNMVSLGTIVIPTTAVADGDAVSVVNVTSTGPADQVPGNNQDSVTTRILDQEIDLVANKGGPSPALAVVGQDYTFTLDVANRGNSPFFGTLTVRDTIPRGFTFVSATGSGWSCILIPGSPAPGPLDEVECTRTYTQAAPLAADAEADTIDLVLTANTDGSFTNRMAIETTNPSFPDSNPGNDTDTFDIGSGQPGVSADIEVIKNITGSNPLNAGELQTYTLELVNNDVGNPPTIPPASSLDVTLTDRFQNLINDRDTGAQPGFDNFSIADPNGIATNLSCSTASTGGRERLLTCTADALAPCVSGSTCPIVTVQVRHGTNLTTIPNRADIVSATTPDPDLSNNFDETSFTQNRLTEVTVTKTSSAPSTQAGQNVVFTIVGSVVNTGQSNADNFTITDRLPPGTRFISAVSPQGTCTTPFAENDIVPAAPNNEIVCSYGSVGNNEQRTLTITLQPTNAQVPGPTTLVNTAEVDTDTPQEGADPNEGNQTDTASAQTTVTAAASDLLINKDDTVDPLGLGNNTLYTISVTNLGPSTSEDIQVIDTLPNAGMEYVRFIIGGGGSCDDSMVDSDNIGGTLVCDLPDLREDEVFTFQVEMTGVARGDFDNRVEVRSFETLNGLDGDTGNNVNTENTTVRTITDLSITKTASATSVALEEAFTYEIGVVVASGAALAENVQVTDTLPAGMVLTGTPTTPFLANACIGGPGSTNFICNLGDVPAGTNTTITVPVQVLSVTSNPQTLRNNAAVTTDSINITTNPVTAFDDVEVVSSSIAGTLFRDYDNNGLQNLTEDTGIAGVTMTLTGTNPDGRTITRTAVTDASGNYIFDTLPGSGWTYAITRGDPSDPLFSDGIDTPGTGGGGTASAPNAITGIQVPDRTAATDYDFTLIPTPTIGLAKDLTDQVQNADGSFSATFNLVVENLSGEPLNNISVNDPLSGSAPRFGTLATPANPATDPLALGTYAIVQTGSGSCGGFNAGYDGNTNTVLASGFSLAAGANCTIAFRIRVEPTSPLPPTQPSGGQYENQATTQGTGALTGQTANDTSDDGTDTDSDGDNIADEAGENDPTPVTAGLAPGIALLKEIDTSALSSPPVEGDIVTYNFSIRNTGNVTLTNVVVTDPLRGITLSGTPVASIGPGQTITGVVTGRYALTQLNIDAGTLQNQAMVTGTPPIGSDVSDMSGTGFGNDDPTVLTITDGPAVQVIKTADTSALQNPPQVGDTITYRFEVRNTGNVTLTDVTVTDPLPGLVLQGSPIASMAPGDIDSATYVGTYMLTPSDLTEGARLNTAFVTGDPPTGSAVTDDDPESVTLPAAPGIELVKSITDASAFDDGVQVGDQIFYGFRITNTGNVPLRDVTVTDMLPGIVLSGGPIALMNPAAAGDGTNVDSTTYTAVYTLTAADVANFGVVENTATATGTYGPAASALTVSGSSTVTAQPPNPSDGLTLLKTTPDDVVQRGTIVPYTLQLRNDNPFPATNLDLVDTLPEGLIYIDGSATFEGSSFAVNVAGQTITFGGITVPANSTVTARLNARILNGANPGTYVNTAIALDPLYGLVAGPATAEIRILPEAVFDCSDVIGRVFDDLDGDGYQDAYDPNAIPEDPNGEAKIEEVTEVLTDEVGLPGVRLVTLDGLVITTDQNGLFSVPCAALPADIGSNFLLSLDERTLPLGYTMTTQNPRVMRLTPGVMTEMNFGARLAQVMRVDLSAQAFAHGPTVSAPMRDGIASMVARLLVEPSIVELVYHLPANAGPDAVAEGRLAMGRVAEEINRQWSSNGTGRLRIEQTLTRRGE